MHILQVIWEQVWLTFLRRVNNVWDKVKAAGAFIAIGVAAVFYILFNSEKRKRIISERTNDVNSAENKASNVAKEKHEEANKNGSIGLANNTADIIDK